MRPPRLLLAALLCLGAALPARAQTLVVCTEASPSTLNAQLSTSGTVFDVAAQMYDELVEIELGGTRLVPALAERWDVAPDGLSVTFHLRAGVHFQSSAQFTPMRDLDADDVVFSFHRMMDKANPYYPVGGASYDEYAALLAGRLRDVVKLDDHTVRFDLAEPVAPLLGILSMPAFAILSAEYADHLQKAGTPERIDTAPIGTGPFSFVRFQRDQEVRFRAFDGSWTKRAGMTDRAAAVPNLVFAITQDPAVRLLKLRAGECQVARFPAPADYPAIRVDPALSLVAAPMPAMGYIAFRSDRPPFDKPQVRQALAQAIDLDALVKTVFQGTGTPTGALIPPSLWGSDPGVKPWPHDPEGARRLLAQAGYPQGFHTQLWAIPVSRPYMPDGRRAAEMIQADWAKVGVQADIVTLEWGEYLRRVRAGDAPVGMLGGSWDYPDPSQLVYGYWACPGGVPRPGNWPHWCDAAFTEAVGKANVLSDQDARAALYRQAQETWHDAVPGVLFADVNAYTALRRSVHGFRMRVMGGQPFAGVSP